MHPKPGAQPNKSLIDGIEALQALAVSKEPIGCRELARQLDIEPTRLNRLLKTLAYLGMARQTKNRKYTAGPGMHILATQSLYASGLLNSSIPPLESLKRFGGVVALGVLWHDSVSYLYHALPGMHSDAAIGRRGLFSATTSGIGIALLAATSEEYIRELYQDGPISGFPDGIESLLSTIEETKKQGYARIQVIPQEPQFPDEPHFTIAMTIGRPPFSAVGVSGWIPDSGTEIVIEALKQAINEIETALDIQE